MEKDMLSKYQPKESWYSYINTKQTEMWQKASLALKRITTHW